MFGLYLVNNYSQGRRELELTLGNYNRVIGLGGVKVNTDLGVRRTGIDIGREGINLSISYHDSNWSYERKGLNYSVTWEDILKGPMMGSEVVRGIPTRLDREVNLDFEGPCNVAYYITPVMVRIKYRRWFPKDHYMYDVSRDRDFYRNGEVVNMGGIRYTDCLDYVEFIESDIKMVERTADTSRVRSDVIRHYGGSYVYPENK